MEGRVNGFAYESSQTCKERNHVNGCGSSDSARGGKVYREISIRLTPRALSGLKKSKSVGIITLSSEKPDYVPSYPEPAVAISLMNFGHVSDGPEYKPVYQPKPQERVFESENEKGLEEIRNVRKVMSKRKMTKPKIKKIENDKSLFRNLNDVHILNGVNKRNLCGPENSEKGKFEAAHDVGGGSEPEKDEIEEDDSAES